jgi:hypothetical protein
MAVKDILLKFRDLEITKEVFDQTINKNIQFKGDLIEVTNQHVIRLLEAYLNGSINEQQILDWVNTIWFSGYYEYSDEYADSIAGVMNELEEIDEVGKELTREKAVIFIEALKNNIEYK